MIESNSPNAPQRGRYRGSADKSFNDYRNYGQQSYWPSNRPPTSAPSNHKSSSFQNAPLHAQMAPPNAYPKGRLSRTLTYSSGSRVSNNSNWRARNERPQVAANIPYNPLPEYQGLDANRSTVMIKKVCAVGKIIRAAVHEQDFNDSPGCLAASNDGHSTVSKYGNIYSKVRWMIVIAVYHGHYLTIPLYTHNGTGLSKKSEAAKLEYVSVQDVRHAGYFENLSRQGRLRAHMDRGTTLLSRDSVAHLTAPVTRKYGMLVEELGQLDDESVDHLVKIWRKTVFGDA